MKARTQGRPELYPNNFAPSRQTHLRHHLLRRFFNLLLYIACQPLYYSKASNHGRESAPSMPRVSSRRLDQTDNSKNQQLASKLAAAQASGGQAPYSGGPPSGPQSAPQAGQRPSGPSVGQATYSEGKTSFAFSGILAEPH
jgi:hypothetical protein